MDAEPTVIDPTDLARRLIVMEGGDLHVKLAELIKAHHLLAFQTSQVVLSLTERIDALEKQVAQLQGDAE